MVTHHMEYFVEDDAPHLWSWVCHTCMIESEAIYTTLGDAEAAGDEQHVPEEPRR